MSTITSPSFDALAASSSKRLPVESAMPGTTLGIIKIKAFGTGSGVYGEPLHCARVAVGRHGEVCCHVGGTIHCTCMCACMKPGGVRAHALVSGHADAAH